jgi:hypothetical protein
VFRFVAICLSLSAFCMSQQPRSPDVAVQREAMRKLNFLAGKWSGEARILQPSAEPVVLEQTEEAQYKLDGLLLTIEGFGRSKSDGKAVLQAFGTISYDDETQTYHMRAYNDGRYLETEVRLSDKGEGLTWGFVVGEIRTNSVLRINEKGQWTESTDITVGSQPPRKFLELTVSPQK